MIMTKFEKVETGNNDMKIKRFSTAKIITGHGFDGFKVPVYWGGGPYGYLYFMPKEEFIDCYKKSAIKLGRSRLKFAEVNAMRYQIRLFWLWHNKEKEGSCEAICYFFIFRSTNMPSYLCRSNIFRTFGTDSEMLYSGVPDTVINPRAW